MNMLVIIVPDGTNSRSVILRGYSSPLHVLLGGDRVLFEDSSRDLWFVFGANDSSVSRPFFIVCEVRD